MRYGVGYDQETGIIEAGPVRATGDDESFIMKSNVTDQAIGAVAEWLVASSFGVGMYIMHDVTDAAGNHYQIAARRMA